MVGDDFQPVEVIGPADTPAGVGPLTDPQMIAAGIAQHAREVADFLFPPERSLRPRQPHEED